MGCSSILCVVGLYAQTCSPGCSPPIASPPCFVATCVSAVKLNHRGSGLNNPHIVASIYDASLVLAAAKARGAFTSEWSVTQIFAYMLYSVQRKQQEIRIK